MFRVGRVPLYSASRGVRTRFPSIASVPMQRSSTSDVLTGCFLPALDGGGSGACLVLGPGRSRCAFQYSSLRRLQLMQRLPISDVLFSVMSAAGRGAVMSRAVPMVSLRPHRAHESRDIECSRAGPADGDAHVVTRARARVGTACDGERHGTGLTTSREPRWTPCC